MTRVRYGFETVDVLEEADEIADLLVEATADWLRLTGREDGQPIWLRADTIEALLGCSSQAVGRATREVGEVSPVDVWTECDGSDLGDLEVR